MKYRQRIGKIPEGTPIAGQTVTARRIDTGESLGSGVTDSNGFVTFQADGHWPPFYLHLSNVPGGDKYWRSDESHTVGAINPKQIPIAMMALGDGVVRGYTGMLAVSLSSGGPSVFVAPGAANVAGYPVVFYGTTFVPNTRPTSGTRIDLIIIELSLENSTRGHGLAELEVLPDTSGDLTMAKNDIHWQFPLAQLTIPSSGAITLTDVRQYTGEPVSITDASSSPAESTANTSGVYLPNLDLALTLAPNTTYDITAWVTATQDVAGGRTPALTFGSFGSALGNPPQFRNVQQIAVDSVGNVITTDTDNDREYRLDASGTIVSDLFLRGMGGVCVDASDNAYLVGTNPNASVGYKGWGWKYPGAISEGVSPTAGWDSSTDGPRHCATDGTYLWFTGRDPTSGTSYISRRNTSDLAGDHLVDTDLNDSIGIAYFGGELYVVDAGNLRVKVLTSGPVADVVVRTWSIPAGGSGIAIDSTGRIYITFTSENLVRRYNSTGVLQDAFFQTSPLGIAAGPSNVLWVSDTAAHNLTRYDLVPAGYGQVAIDINAQGAGTYTGIGNVNGTVQMTKTYSLTSTAGGDTISIRLSAKATSGTATFRNVVFSARAVPRGV